MQLLLPPLPHAAAAAAGVVAAVAAVGLLLLLLVRAVPQTFLLLLVLVGGQVRVGGLVEVSAWRWGVRGPCCGHQCFPGAAPCRPINTNQHQDSMAGSSGISGTMVAPY